MTDEYYLAMAALDRYERLTADRLPKSTSVVFRIDQLGHAAERAEAERDQAVRWLVQWKRSFGDAATIDSVLAELHARMAATP